MSENGMKTSLSGSLLRGNFVKQDLSQEAVAKKYILSDGEKGLAFYCMPDSYTIAANNCWMEWGAGQTESTSFMIAFGDETGIEEVGSKSQLHDNESHIIYNMAGQRLNSPQKGMNIINNRKVVVK
jgi:hypothetical protein